MPRYLSQKNVLVISHLHRVTGSSKVWANGIQKYQDCVAKKFQMVSTIFWVIGKQPLSVIASNFVQIILQAWKIIANKIQTKR